MVRVAFPASVLMLTSAFMGTVRSGNEPPVRKRREWIVPAWPVKENVDHTQKESIAKIRSDFQVDRDISYSLEGVGATQYPFNVFVVDPKTGLIRVTQVLDREAIDTYNLLAIARFNDGAEAEKRIDLRIKVLDENDNEPQFDSTDPVDVYERSPAGTPVTRVTATDADEPGNPNSQLLYTIVKQEPPHNMFRINKDGNIYVDKSTLDREETDQYFVTVQAQDLNGDPDGLTGTSTVTINVLDVNDNLPTLEKDQYEGSFMENTQGVEVIRIKAQDLDLEDTENWQSVFDIVKGNEAKYFSIKTDPKTNEGVLMLDKAVDYEDVKDLVLGLTVRNKAPPYEGLEESTTYKTYPVKINVQNQREGPYFDPKVKVVTLSEGGSTISINDVITRYPALDGDTGKQAEKVKYLKGSDPDNWLTIEPKTGDITLNKMPDRESTFLVNGTYYAKILCISEDIPSSTATGTVAIQVEDFNDHYPTLTSTLQTLCIPDDAVIVTAVDEDDYPNGAPFTFEIIPEGAKGKWQVEHLNDTAAILRAQHSLWPGLHEVELLVRDEQGEACPEPQKVTVQVCTCEDRVSCGSQGGMGQPNKRSALGPAGIGLLLLGLLLLLLVPLLVLFCQCGGAVRLPVGAADIPFETKSHLVNYCTEGQGENAEVPLNLMPTKMVAEDVRDRMNQSVFVDAFEGNVAQSWARRQGNANAFYSRFGGTAVGGQATAAYDSIALPEHLLAQYYQQRVYSRSGAGSLAEKDAQLKYNFEGQGSSAGSVGCCSLLENDVDLQFLDHLGPKFKTLAEVCCGQKIQQDVSPLPTKVVIEKSPELPKLPSVVPSVDPTMTQVVEENTTTRNQGMTAVMGGMENQGQMFLLQQEQPLYYTAAAPMQYVVQPQVQNTMLLAEAPATNLQGVVLAAPAQGMLVSSRHTKEAGVVLVENPKVQTKIHAGKHPGLQSMVVVERKLPVGSVKGFRGSQTSLVQGGGEAGWISGAQRVVLVEGSSSGNESVSQKRNNSGSVKSFNIKGTTTKSTGPQVSFPRIPTYRKVVVQQTRK
ncbi:desmoglein-2.1-like isoform X2 [Phyllopteryx taeniolatus]|uniref:desmoglein-2.1-like isoform X2 n=1 Tax=Phyllopteryx taeniolatus TaxID=161469 RepID=UPI002AD33E0A|nr:desmoglein-2.1-like isoform X2 [Phyllopteryx taeniolatus]